MSDAIQWHSSIAKEFDIKYRTKKTFRERYMVWERLIRKYSHEKGRVLDIGCGSGIFTFLAGRNSREVLGIDASVQMIELCHSKREETQAGNVDFQCCKLEDIKVSDLGTFELILCSSILEYMSDFQSAFRTILALLQPRGVLLFSLPNSQSLYRRLEQLLFRWTGKPAYYAFVQNSLCEHAAKELAEDESLELVEIGYYAATPGLSPLFRLIGKRAWADNLIVLACRKRG